MEKSIESIWKEGFLENDALIAPKINELYNQKSKHITDKLKRMFKINLYLIVVMAALVFIVYSFLGVPIAGLSIALLLMGVFGLAKKQGKSLRAIEHSLTSYEYLRTFNNWVQSIIASNVKVMRFFYPLVFLASMAPIWYTFKNGKITAKILEESDLTMLFGFPLVALIVVFSIMTVMYIFGGTIYRWDVNIVYGRVFKKLESLIKDMEELRN